MKSILYSVIALALLTACSKEPDSSEIVVDLAAGKAIAEAECAECHGLDGRGETAEIPNLTGQSTEYLVEALHAYRDGGRLHATLQDLVSSMDEADISNIAGYYSSQPPLKAIHNKQPGQAYESAYSEGAEIAALCENCHGERGISTTEGMPSLAGQQPAYLIIATHEYKTGERKHDDKNEMLKGLEQVDIEKMAMYFASQVAPPREAPAFGDPAAGKTASAKCAKCHGERGISHQPLIPNLAGQEPAYLLNTIKNYRKNKFDCEEQLQGKTTQQFEDIAAYFAIQKTDASVESDLTVEKLVAKCDRCHNPSEKERKLNIPALEGQSYDYLVKAMQEYRNEDRDNSMMHKMSSRYSDEMIDTLASHYASQSGSD